MATLAHCSFHDRLTMKAEHGASVDENCTSKTCSNCKNSNDDLGSSKIYSCLECSSVFERYFKAVKHHARVLQRAIDGKRWVYNEIYSEWRKWSTRYDGSRTLRNWVHLAAMQASCGFTRRVEAKWKGKQRNWKEWRLVNHEPYYRIRGCVGNRSG